MALSSRGERRLIVGGGLAALALAVWRPVDHGDTFIYGATGRWIADHHAIPRVDPFAWTQLGRPWQSNAWGWGVVLWATNAIGGLEGLALLKPIVVVATVVSTTWAARRFGARRLPADLAALVAIVLMFPWISDRPQLISYALFPVTLAAAHLAGRDGRLHGWWLAAVGALFVLWINLHSVALFGAMAVGTLEAGALIDRLWARRRPVEVQGAAEPRPRAVSVFVAPVVIAAVAVLATFVNPWGWRLHQHSVDVRRLSSSTISEWYPLLKSGPVAIIPVAVAVAVVVVIVRAGARRRAELILPLVFSAVLTVDAIRNAPFFILAAAVLATPMLTGRPVAIAQRRDLAIVAVVAALVMGLVLGVPRILDSNDVGPNIAAASTAALPAGCHLRNDYRLGGYVIWARPDILVSADGRNDLYGLHGYDQNVWFEEPAAAAGAPAIFRGEGTDCVLATPDSPLIPVLEADGWRVVGEDSTGVALVS